MAAPMAEHARSLLLLWGFMGSGKTTLGRALAERAGVPFVDLDDEIERAAGMPIAAIFAAHGEAAFRAIERDALMRVLDADGKAVVALGGGALVDPTLRARALAEAFVVTLTAPLGVLLARIEKSDRPLAGQAARLFEDRRTVYADTHRTLDTSGDEVGAMVEALLNVWSGWRA